MPKFEVTENMGSSLRDVRIKNNIKAIDVAKSIGKTGAFISKLEKGDLNTIEADDLYGIILFLTGDEEKIDETLVSIIQNASINYSSFEKEKEEWFLNFDYMYRKISVPKKYIDYVNQQLDSNDISLAELVGYINSNADLYSEKGFTKDQLDNSTKNRWYFNNGNSYVVMETSLEQVEPLLSFTNRESSYGLLFCILLSTYRLSNIEKKEAYKKTRELLKSFNIYTLMEKQEIMESFHSDKEMKTLLSQRNNADLPKEDQKFYSLLNQFTEECDIFAEFHREYTNEKLETFLNNFKNDPILIVGLMGVDLSKLKDCNIKIKKEFVDSFSQLIDKYSNKKPNDEDVLI